MQTSGHVDDDVLISELDAFHEMGGRKSRYFGEVLAIGDDASVASKPGSSAASASDSKETTHSSPAPSARPSSAKDAEQTAGVIVSLVSIHGVKKNLTLQKQMALEAVKKMLTEGWPLI